MGTGYRPKIASSMLQLLGNTPLVRLHSLGKEYPAELIAKLEFFNPAASVKDRVADALILAAEKEGKLQPGATIVEPTSGNTGIGLAFVAAIKGYKLILTMPESMSMERKALLRGVGATLVLTPKEKGMQGAIDAARDIVAATPNALMLNQFSNPAAWQAHYMTTGPEILHDCEGKLDAFVAGMGTSGTVTGVGKYLREHIPHMQIYGVEPSESPVVSGGKAAPHGIQGIGAGFIPDILDRTVLTDVLTVSTEEALATARRLILEESIWGGISSGANAAAALALAQRPEFAGKRIVFMVCDTAERYLSTALFPQEKI